MPKFSVDCLHRKDGEKDARTVRGTQYCGEILANGDDPGQLCSYKLFICEQSDCVEKPGGYSKLQVDRLDFQGILVQTQVKIPIPTQRRVLKDGKGMLNCSLSQENL